MDRLSFIRWWRGPWGLKKSVEALAAGVVLAAALSIFLGIGQQQKSSSTGCQFPAIYNFGDSNSDTGGLSATFFRLPSPYGNTFFGKPSGRFSDGRLIIDFIAQRLGFPFLSAYLDSLGSNFHYGASFATGGSTIQPLDGKMFEARYSPISLNVQLMQFSQIQARVNEVFTQDKSSKVPRPRDFSKALYTFDIGQNDLHAGLRLKTVDQVMASISNITAQLASTIEQLYQQGARVFWIHNTGPLGCLPASLAYKLPKPEDLDQNGCLKSDNEVAQEFNRQLKERVLGLRTQLSEAVLTYVDLYSAKYTLINEADKYDFISPLAQCCGSYGDRLVHCGMKAIVNGTEVEALCSNPSKYISWDGVHYSDAANQWIANQIIDGSFSDPPVSITEASQKLGFPFLSAYLDSIGTNFRYGANFATGGSTIWFWPLDGRMFEARYSPISLNIQLLQFVQLKAHVKCIGSRKLKSIIQRKFLKSSKVMASLPRPKDFSEALYTIDNGQNDLNAWLTWKTVDQVMASISTPLRS